MMRAARPTKFATMPKSIRILVYGMFGAANFGDELFARVVADAIAVDSRFGVPTVLTSDAFVTRDSIGVPHEAVEGSALTAQLRNFDAVRDAVRAADHVLIGGGALFGEGFLRASIVHAVAVAAAAYAAGTPYTLHGIGVDRVNLTINRRITRWCFRNAERVMVRSERDRQQALAITGLNVERGVDLNHAWLRANAATAERLKPVLCINLQHALKVEDPVVAHIVRDYRNRGYFVRWIVPSDGDAERVRDHYTGQFDQLSVTPTLDNEAAALRSGTAFLTQRFHHTMAGLQSPHPVEAIVSSKKVYDLVAQLRDAGAHVDQVRASSRVADEVVSIPPSPERDMLTRQWAKESNLQLSSVLNGIAKEAAHPRKRPATSSLPLALMNAVFLGYYALDRLAPLRYVGAMP